MMLGIEKCETSVHLQRVLFCTFGMKSSVIFSVFRSRVVISG